MVPPRRTTVQGTTSKKRPPRGRSGAARRPSALTPGGVHRPVDGPARPVPAPLLPHKRAAPDRRRALQRLAEALYGATASNIWSGHHAHQAPDQGRSGAARRPSALTPGPAPRPSDAISTPHPRAAPPPQEGSTRPQEGATSTGRGALWRHRVEHAVREPRRRSARPGGGRALPGGLRPCSRAWRRDPAVSCPLRAGIDHAGDALFRIFSEACGVATGVETTRRTASILSPTLVVGCGMLR